MLRFAPLPPNTMDAWGTRVAFDDDPPTTRLPAAVSASPTVKASAWVDVPATIVVSGISLMTGVVFAAAGAVAAMTFV